MFGEVLKNTIFQLFGRFGSVAVSLVLTRLIFTSFGEEGYGAYAFISSVVLLFAQVSDWGTNIITVREASKDVNNSSKIFGGMILFRLLLSVFAIVLLNIFIRINPGWQDMVLPTTLASFLILFLSLKTSSFIIFQSLRRLDLISFFDFIFSLLFLLISYISINIFGAQLIILMFAWVVTTLFVGFMSLLASSCLSEIDWSIDKKLVGNIIMSSVPTGALFIVFSLYNKIDIVILQYFHGSQAVAPYALAYKVYDNTVLAAAFLMNSLFPLLSQQFSRFLNNSSLIELKKYYQKAFEILLFASLVLFIILQVFAGSITQVLSGSQYLGAEQSLRILSFAVVIAFFNHLTGFSLIAFGKQKLSLIIATCALVFNVISNIILIPIYSFIGASWLTVATEGVVLIISSILIWKKFNLIPSILFFKKR